MLKQENYLYDIQGDKIIVTHKGSVGLYSLKTLPPGVGFKNRGNVGLYSLETLPPGVGFMNGGYVDLYSLKTLPPGVEFKNDGGVRLNGILGGWLNEWEGNIEGVDDKRLLRLMANKELFL